MLALEGNNLIKNKTVILPSDKDISDALAYYFRVATQEVKEFVKPEIIKKIAVESQGILYSKSRVMDGQRFTLSGDLKDSGILAGCTHSHSSCREILTTSLLHWTLCS